MGGWATSQLLWGGGVPKRFNAGDKIKIGATCGRIGYIICAVQGGGGGWHKALVVGFVNLWQRLLASRGGGPQHFTTGDKIRIEPTCGQIGYITPAVRGVPNASKQGTKSQLGPHVGRLATSSLPLRGPSTIQSGGQNQNWAHMWADGLHHSCRLGFLNASQRGTKSESGPHAGGLATSALPSPTLQSGGQNQNWAHMWADGLHHSCYGGGRGPQTLQCGRQNQNWGHMWADWLHHLCRPRGGGGVGTRPWWLALLACGGAYWPLGGPQHFTTGDKIRIEPTCGQIGYITPAVRGVPNASKQGTKSQLGPHVGGLATSSLPLRGSSTIQSGGQNQNWAHMWADGLHHSCRLGFLNASQRGTKSESGPHVGGLATSPLPCGGVPNSSERGAKSEVGPHVGGLATTSLLLGGGGGPQHFRVRDKIRIGPTCGRIGYITPAVWGVHNALERGTKSELGPHVGGLAIPSLLSGASPTLHNGGQNQNWAHMWADWLHHPCRLGGPQLFRAGDKIRIGPTCGKLLP